MRNNNGIFGFVLLFVVFGMFAGCAFIYNATTSGTRQSNAEHEAQTFANEMYPGETPVHAVCQGIDTDSNGYVSCSIRIGTRPIVPMECASYVMFAFNHGCRAVRLVMPTSGQ